ncbi:MAG: hypothetical protein DA328_01740 [Nitrososphaeraceae archaeon]|nr:hypothetical protein [Nitrososphaeraceae archaeon]
MTQKKELKRKENHDKLLKALATLESIMKIENMPRNIRNLLKESYNLLKDEKNGLVSVRAANAISMLDSITQNPQMQSHIRTMIWQLVSILEGIRE